MKWMCRMRFRKIYLTAIFTLGKIQFSIIDIYRLLFLQFVEHIGKVEVRFAKCKMHTCENRYLKKHFAIDKCGVKNATCSIHRNLCRTGFEKVINQILQLQVTVLIRNTDTLSARVFVTDGNYRTEKKTKGYKIAANYLYKTIFLKSGFFQQFS